MKTHFYFYIFRLQRIKTDKIPKKVPVQFFKFFILVGLVGSKLGCFVLLD